MYFRGGKKCYFQWWKYVFPWWKYVFPWWKEVFFSVVEICISVVEISKKKHEMIDNILKMLVYRRREGFHEKEDIKSYIESEKFNVKNTVRDINNIFKMMYERSKMCQLNYYPELQL